ncbi:hypothetical protein FLJU110815_10770 [Flavobacterium jumunjinense]
MILSFLNLIFLFVATFSMCIIGMIENVSQIKYGYYLFIINSILILIESRNLLKKSKV